jgi:hypothetical protein
MAKWPAGIVLAGIVIGLMFFAMEQPWFTNSDITNDASQTAEVTVETDYYLTGYEAEASANGTAISTGFIDYENEPVEGGWNADYQEHGHEAKNEVFSTSYNLVLLTMLMAVLSAITIPIAGMGYMTPIVPKLFCVLMIIFSILAPIYFAVFLPGAFEEDQEKLCEFHPDDPRYHDEDGVCLEVKQADGFMASSEDKDRDTGRIVGEQEWGPGFGWWMAVISIFLAMFAFVCAEGKKKAPPLDERRPDDYHDDYADPYDNRHGSPDPYGGGRDPYGGPGPGAPRDPYGGGPGYGGGGGPGYGGPPPRGPGGQHIY